MKEELRGLSGGAKQLWLRSHRAEVDEFYRRHGPDATMAEYGMRAATLARFLLRRQKDIRINKMSEADRMVLRIAMEGDRELKRRIARLEEWQTAVEPVIQVGRGIIATLAGFKGKVEQLPVKDNPLSLANFGRKSGK